MGIDGPDRKPRSVRDRRGHGRRGPDLLPSLLAPHGVPAALTRSERFDRIALQVLDEIERRWPRDVEHVELAVEEVPVLPTGWAGDEMPLGALRPMPRARAQLVVFRRPIEHRVGSREDLMLVLLRTMCDHLAPVIGLPPSAIHPDYE